MKFEIDQLLGRHAPAALLLALLAQGVGAVWWMAERDRDHFFVEQRVTNLETAQMRTQDGQERVLERLARMEAEMDGAAKSLDRIERQMARKQ
jgi:hypothetical protein